MTELTGALDDSHPSRVRRVGAQAAWPITVAAVVMVLLVWVFSLWVIVADRGKTLERAESDLQNLARAYAEHVGKTLQAADQALRFLRSVYRREGQALNIRGYLDKQDIIGADLNQMAIIGTDGFLTHSSVPFTRMDLGDREHFRVHRQSHKDRLFVSKPVLGRASGKWSIQLTRPVLAADGSFGGVSVLSLSPDYFNKVFGETAMDKDMVIRLFGADGVVRAEAPAEERALGADIRQLGLFDAALKTKQGVVHQPDPGDGQQRIWAYQSLDMYEQFVAIGRSTAQILTHWRRRVQVIVFSASLASLCVVSMAWVLRRRMVRQAELVVSLEATTARLRDVVAVMAGGSTAVATAGATMSESAQSLAIRTDRQGEQLGVTSAVVREVVLQVRSNADHINAVDSRCVALREQTEGGRVVVSRSVEAIKAIASRTREMGEAVSMIESIAFQTNILSLNAAVEAARAGEAGRAFAVVAAEVRALADRSRQSAGEVRRLIMAANEQAAVGVEQGATVQQVLNGIASGVSGLAGDLNAVSRASSEQSGSLQQVMDGLDELDQLTRTNADMVAQSVMAAEDMREHSQKLQMVVDDIGRDLQLAGAAAPGAASGQADVQPPALTAGPPPVATARTGAEVEYF